MNNITYVGRFADMTTQRSAHDNWELVYCTAGHGVIEHERGSLAYRQGDVAVLPPMCRHRSTFSEDHQCIRLLMDQPIPTFQEPAVITDDENHFLLDAFRAMQHHFSSDSPERLALLICYRELICCYLLAYQQDQQHAGIAGEIKRCILANYADHSFKLAPYFSTLPFSAGYLRKLFQKTYGVTPQQYLIDLRLQAAAEALVQARYSGHSVGDIANLCGFRDPLYFSKMFKKKYGVSPTQFAGTPGDAALT